MSFPGEYFPPTLPLSEWGHGDRDRPHNHALLKDRDHYLLTVHRFTAGGFEATVRNVDAQKLEDMRLRPRGVRKPVEERDEKDMVRSSNRAKKIVRHAIKEIGCDRLLTLTTRAKEKDPDILAKQWKEFVRRYRKYSGDEFLYVAVPERHPKNPKHWHLHIAIRGYLKLNIARGIWWHLCGGRDMSNIDVQFIKIGCDAVTGRPLGPLVRSARIARYVFQIHNQGFEVLAPPRQKVLLAI